MFPKTVFPLLIGIPAAGNVPSPSANCFCYRGVGLMNTCYVKLLSQFEVWEGLSLYEGGSPKQGESYREAFGKTLFRS